MSLPKIDVPTYTAKLESTQELITYRPFLVKEEKILLMALESENGDDMLKAVQEIITACILEGKVNVKELPTFDLEYIFLKIRSKSIGEISTLAIPCEECENKNQVDINLDQIELKISKKHSTKIELTDSIGLIMKYPTIQMITNIDQLTPENSLEVISSCVDSVYDGNKEYDFSDYTASERGEFLDNLTQKQLSNIQDFFETMPSLEHDLDYKCTACGHKGSLNIRGLQNFFS